MVKTVNLLEMPHDEVSKAVCIPRFLSPYHICSTSSLCMQNIRNVTMGYQISNFMPNLLNYVLLNKYMFVLKEIMLFTLYRLTYFASFGGTSLNHSRSVLP